MDHSDPSNDDLMNLLKRFVQANPSSPAQRAAHSAFYQSLYKTLDRQALRATRYNEELASVAVQEAWLKIFRTAHSYDPAKSTVKTWAKMITTRCAIDELRRHYRHHPASERDDTPDWPQEAGDEQALVCPLPSTEERAHQNQVERAAADCLAALPSSNGPNYRLAMELSLDPELTYAEMTSLLQLQMPRAASINAEQVRGWVRHAVKRMRACLTARLGMQGENYA